MKLFKKIICFSIGHKLEIVYSSKFYQVDRLYCNRCKNYFHREHSQKTFLKEDRELYCLYLQLREWDMEAGEITSNKQEGNL